jgi:hypothetical protein
MGHLGGFGCSLPKFGERCFFLVCPGKSHSIRVLPLICGLTLDKSPIFSTMKAGDRHLRCWLNCGSWESWWGVLHMRVRSSDFTLRISILGFCGKFHQNTVTAPQKWL